MLSTFDLLVLTSLDHLFIDIEDIVYAFTKQDTLMRRSSVQSLPLQLVFPEFYNATL
jgi:hypothetical protein